MYLFNGVFLAYKYYFRYFGPSWVERLQHQAAGVYYNTHVEMNMQVGN